MLGERIRGPARPVRRCVPDRWGELRGEPTPQHTSSPWTGQVPPSAGCAPSAESLFEADCEIVVSSFHTDSEENHMPAKEPVPADQPDKVKGPASYFPSIEKTYGRSIADWKAMINACPLTRHSDLVNWLKSEHGMGHGRHERSRGPHDRREQTLTPTAPDDASVVGTCTTNATASAPRGVPDTTRSASTVASEQR